MKTSIQGKSRIPVASCTEKPQKKTNIAKENHIIAKNVIKCLNQIRQNIHLMYKL